MIEEMHSQGLDVTVFFYNPNIHPRKETQRGGFGGGNSGGV